jgi:hypothetical protein
LKNLDPTRTEVHIRRSERLRNAMLLLADDLEAYDAAVALLAVHCAISLNDAIQVGSTGKRSRYESHVQTVSDLERICRSNRIDTLGIVHLKWLLTNKTAISYGDRRFTDTAVARDKAERFQAWAYSSFKEVLRVQEYS